MAKAKKTPVAPLWLTQHVGDTTVGATFTDTGEGIALRTNAAAGKSSVELVQHITDPADIHELLLRVQQYAEKYPMKEQA